jgi:predicted nucleic acid-binding protein
MLLVDTCIWVDHLRRVNARLVELLADDEAACHPFVIGELACGIIANRHEILSLLSALPSLPQATDEELLTFMEQHSLMGKGLGLIDVHLLASCRLANVALWTRDERLRKAARALDVSPE